MHEQLYGTRRDEKVLGDGGGRGLGGETVKLVEEHPVVFGQ